MGTWFEQAPGVGDGQGSLECCSPWGCKESDTTERLNNNNIRGVLLHITWQPGCEGRWGSRDTCLRLSPFAAHLKLWQCCYQLHSNVEEKVYKTKPNQYHRCLLLANSIFAIQPVCWNVFVARRPMPTCFRDIVDTCGAAYTLRCSLHLFLSWAQSRKHSAFLVQLWPCKQVSFSRPTQYYIFHIFGLFCWWFCSLKWPLV